jgi:WXG100 family type VII secretion target
MGHPMNRPLRVDSDRVDELTRTMDAAIDEIEKILDSLDTRVGHLSQQWSGEASIAYGVAHRNWDGSIRELEAIARKLSAVTKSGSMRFRSMERATARVWGG